MEVTYHTITLQIKTMLLKAPIAMTTTQDIMQSNKILTSQKSAVSPLNK